MHECRLVSLPAHGSDAPFLSASWDAQWSAEQGCPRNSMSEKLVGQLRDSFILISTTDLAIVLSTISEATALLPLPASCVLASSPSMSPRPSTSLPQPPLDPIACRAAADVAVKLNIGKTELLLVGDEQSGSNGRLLCGFAAAELFTNKGQPLTREGGEQSSNKGGHKQPPGREETTVLCKVTDMALMDISSSSSSSTTNEGALARSGIKLDIKIQRKGQACPGTTTEELRRLGGVVATNVDVILSSQPSFNLVLSQRQLHILLGFARIFR
jgi:hypothetical protein